MDNIFILDRDKIKRDILSNHGSDPPNPFYNDKRKIYLNTGAETLEFDTHGLACFNGYLVLGNYAMFKENDKYYLYQIMSVDTEHEDDMVKNCYCETVGLELRNHAVRAMTIEGDVCNFFNTILVDSPFKLGYVEDGINEVKSVKVEKPVGAYQLIQDNLSTFNIEIEFAVEYKNNRVVGQVINVYRQRGKETNIRFEYGNNVNKVKKSEDLSEFCSALIGIGSGCDFKNNEWSISNGNPVNKPLNQDFIADMEAFNFKNNNGSHIMGIFEGKSTNGADLLLETWNELQRIKVPKIDYEFNIAVLDADEVNIGDTVYCIDNDYNPPLHLSARVGVLELSSTDPSKNKCTLSNYKEVKSKIKILNKEDIMQDVLDYLSKLEVGILTEADMKILRDYMEKMSFTKEEIDTLFSKYQNVMNGIYLEGSVINVTLENKRYYKCNVLGKLTLNVTNTTDSNFRSIIEFTTGYDCYPMQLFQSNEIWMLGEDCKNGVLINKADTKYRITVTYINNVEYPRKFKGEVEILERGVGTYKVSSKFSKADEMINLSLQYYNNRALFKYNQLTPLSYYAQGKKAADYVDKWKTNGLFHIDCSTFTNSLYRARGYDNSIYKNLDYGMGASKKYGWGFDIGRTASDQAKWCIENGYQLDISITDETAWWNLQPGDLVFWSARSETSETNVEGRYMQVGHVGIVRTPKTSSGTTTTMEVTTNSDVVLSRTLQNNFPDKLLFFARVRR